MRFPSAILASCILNQCLTATEAGTMGAPAAPAEDDVFSRATGIDANTPPLWSEEFDGTALNTDLWNYDTGATGWGNGELQNYTSSTDNVRVADGRLHITVRKLADGSFTSGRINTKDGMAFKYGILKVRALWPDVVEGLWPAFWTLGSAFPDTAWPASGEIDLYEGGQGLGLSLGKGRRRNVPAVHWEDENMIDPNNPLKIATLKREYDIPEDQPELVLNFHDYMLEWTPEIIRMFLDDVIIYELDISEASCPTCGELREPHFLLTNVAVGGGFTSGSTSSSGVGGSSSGCGQSSVGAACQGLRTNDDISAPTPGTMMIDHIRLYSNEHTELIVPSTTTPVVPAQPTPVPPTPPPPPPTRAPVSVDPMPSPTPPAPTPPPPTPPAPTPPPPTPPAPTPPPPTPPAPTPPPPTPPAPTPPAPTPPPPTPPAPVPAAPAPTPAPMLPIRSTELPTLSPNVAAVVPPSPTPLPPVISPGAGAPAPGAAEDASADHDCSSSSKSGKSGSSKSRSSSGSSSKSCGKSGKGKSGSGSKGGKRGSSTTQTSSLEFQSSAPCSRTTATAGLLVAAGLALL